MPSEMVERVARAICEKSPACAIGNQRPDSRDTLSGDPLWMAFATMARAAIAAMREPTEEMVKEGEEEIFEHMAESAVWSRDATKEGYCAMIDEALKE